MSEKEGGAAWGFVAFVVDEMLLIVLQDQKLEVRKEYLWQDQMVLNIF